jgi:ABC-2 type transport system permease protein/lipopolysaccharide transport system permease protein
MMAGVHVNGDLATWNENTSRGVSQDRPWTALWRARELVGYFALKDLRLRYRQAVLGVVWVLAQPIASVAVFTLVFSRLAGVSSEGVPYPLFALVGMVTWTYFSSTVVSASTVLASNVNLVTKVYFPRIAAPASSLLPPGVDLGVSLLLVGVLATYYGVFAGVRLLLVPAWLLLLVLTAAGVALWVSALNVRYRDVQHAVAPLLQLWLFASPVAYGTGSLSGWQQAVYALNPMAGPIELGRFALTGTQWPGWPLAVSATSAAVVLVTGIRYFGRAQRSFADVI